MSKYGMNRGAARYGHYGAITKHDSTNFTDGECDAIYVGGAGVVVAVSPGGAVVAFTAVAGEIIPIGAIRVNSTDTTATLMIALYERKPGTS